MVLRTAPLCLPLAPCATFFSVGVAVATPLQCNLASALSPGRISRRPLAGPNLSRISSSPALGDSSISLLDHNTCLRDPTPLNPDAVPFSLPTHSILATPCHVLLGAPMETEDELLDDFLDSSDALLSKSLEIEDELWEHFLNSSDASPSKPGPCSCHNLPIGSCPSTIRSTVELISSVRLYPDLTPNMDGARVPLPYCPFPVDVWKAALGAYFDADSLTNGFRYGWDLSFSEVPLPRDASSNLPSSKPAAADVDKYISTELGFGALVGPVDVSSCPFSIFHSPIGAVDKANSAVKRTIVDCSQRGAGINSFIPANLHRGTKWVLKLPNTDSIVASIQAVRARYPGQRLKMFKVDYSRWYRWFAVDPTQIPFLAVRWRNNTYIDRFFCFGNRGAALAAQRTSWAVCHLFRTKVPPHPGSFNSGSSCHCPSHCSCGDNDAQAYIDDTISIVPECLAEHLFESFLDLCKRLGLAISQTPGHVFPPSSQCVALGILFDLENNTISLPKEKLAAILDLLARWLSRSHATERELARLAGKLLWASRVVRPGRIFLNRILATKRRAATAPLAPAPIHLDADFVADLQWWLESLKATNGISFLEFTPACMVSLDASSAGWFDNRPGLAGVNHSTGEYFACPAPPELADWHISALELVCHLIAARLWGHQWRGIQIRGLSDNDACVLLLKNGRSRVDLRLHMARTFATLQLAFGFLWLPEWIATDLNIMPDALSRGGDPKYRAIFRDEAHRQGILPSQSPVLDWMFSVQASPFDHRPA